MTDSEANNFLARIGKLYKDRDNILESSNKIIDFANIIDTKDTAELWNADWDDSEIREIFAKVQKEMNSILSFASELRPHLSNSSFVEELNNKAHFLLLPMSFRGKHLAFKLGTIALGLRVFAQISNRLVLNPTRKSVKQAFGIEIGSEWAKLKAKVEAGYSNY